MKYFSKFGLKRVGDEAMAALIYSKISFPSPFLGPCKDHVFLEHSCKGFHHGSKIRDKYSQKFYPTKETLQPFLMFRKRESKYFFCSLWING